LRPWLMEFLRAYVVFVKSNKPVLCIENARFLEKICTRQTACPSCA
jgi:hypothetical protein